MVQIAVVDDDPEERRRISACLEYVTQKQGTQFAVKEYDDGRNFLGTYMPVFDIVLMDIEMPGMDGVETARNLRKIDKNVILLFVTRMTQYACRGYEVEALDFIVKPVDKYSFALKIARAVSRSAARYGNTLMFRVDGEYVSIRLNMLKYVETDGHYVVYHTFDGLFREYASLKSVEKRLGENFVRCNSCYLVNLRFVTGVRKNNVVIDGEELPISRPKKQEFMNALVAFIGGGG